MNGTHVEPDPVHKPNEDEISLVELFQKFVAWLKLFWIHKLIIISGAFIGLIIGLFIALGTANEYTAQSTILSYSSQPSVNPLGGLAGLVGFGSIGLSSSPVSESMFPTLLGTYPTASRLADKPIRFSSPDTTMPASAYFSEFYREDLYTRTSAFFRSWTVGVPARIARTALAPILNFQNRAKQPIVIEAEKQITKEYSDYSVDLEEMLSKPDMTSQRLLLQIDPTRRKWVQEVASRIVIGGDGRIITVSATMPDPLAAADMANTATIAMMEELTLFEVRKTQDRIRFLESQYDDIFGRFDKAQRDLLSFRDRSLGIVSSVIQIEADRIQTEYTMASSRYTALVAELDAAKFQLNEKTPMFTELDPVQVPLAPSSPNREGILFAWVVLGIVLSSGFVVARHLFTVLKGLL